MTKNEGCIASVKSPLKIKFNTNNEYEQIYVAILWDDTDGFDWRVSELRDWWYYFDCILIGSATFLWPFLLSVDFLVGQCHNFLQGWEVTLPCSYPTILFFSGLLVWRILRILSRSTDLPTSVSYDSPTLAELRLCCELNIYAKKSLSSITRNERKGNEMKGNYERKLWKEIGN